MPTYLIRREIWTNCTKVTKCSPGSISQRGKDSNPKPSQPHKRNQSNP